MTGKETVRAAAAVKGTTVIGGDVGTAAIAGMGRSGATVKIVLAPGAGPVRCTTPMARVGAVAAVKGTPGIRK